MTDKSIHFLPADELVPVQGEDSVLELALKNDIEIAHSCGGMGSCTTCRIFVEKYPGELPPRTELELEIIESRGFADYERLSCQLKPVPGMVVRVPDATVSDFDPT